MKKTPMHAKGKGKGFYVALGICLITLAAAVYIGVTGTIERLNEDKTLELESDITEKGSDDWVFPEAEDVNQVESDVPMESQAASEEVSEEISEETLAQEPAEIAPEFMFPLEGTVINPFSNGELVKSKTLKEWRTHDGVDLKAIANTPVKAAADGTVEEIKEDALWGVCITISHSAGYTSHYRGLKPDVSVKKGQTVAVGEVIGSVGNTAEIEIGEESHLHFALQLEGEWIDPMSVMGNNN